MFYAVLQARGATEIETLKAKLADNANLIQIGADETVGLGRCSVAFNSVQGKEG